jgi:hypothetical protein
LLTRRRSTYGLGVGAYCFGPTHFAPALELGLDRPAVVAPQQHERRRIFALDSGSTHPRAPSVRARAEVDTSVATTSTSLVIGIMSSTSTS